VGDFFGGRLVIVPAITISRSSIGKRGVLFGQAVLGSTPILV
jgi:hypothetical protein